MNRVTGKVLVRESRLGIPNLLVTLYNTSYIAESRDSHGNLVGDDLQQSSWDRLASIITNDVGVFNLSYNNKSGSANSCQPQYLVLTVSSLEDDGNCAAEDYTQRSRIATCVRRNAGEVESFLVLIEESKLRALGIIVPGTQEHVQNLIKRQRAADKIQALLDEESNRLFAERLSKRREFERIAESKFQKFLYALSAGSTSLASSRYIPPGASILDATLKIIRSDIEKKINNATVAGVVALTDEQAASFRGSNGELMSEISESFFDRHIRPQRPPSKSGSLTKKTPPLFVCNRFRPIDSCTKILQEEEEELGVGGVHDGEAEPVQPTEGGNGEAEFKLKVPALVETAVKYMGSPESSTIFQVNSRAGIEQIQDGINGFMLHSGPADVPSFHDFHHLNIAFEHVWQELFDENVTEKSKELYTELVELGLDPNEYLLSLGEKPPIKLLKNDVKKASEASQKSTISPPRYVAQEFQIAPEEWDVLPKRQKRRLRQLSEAINDGMDIHRHAYDPAVDLWKIDGSIEHWRQGGRRIIHYARNILKSKQKPPKAFDQLHEILSELEQDMKRPYRFSIYGADGKERSINFGIIATYRQEWKPEAYQVGELVKTIPLAPKEVRKFTKRIAIRKSRAEKEVENNLQARKTESTETARAETEIVQKAISKTNFDLSADASVNFKIVDVKGSTKFGKDTTVESQEVKKEFREAVFKAAEEYKSERTVEINVSTGEETTLEESGEISNPNDEIPVTYLFYELQRRFKVSEKIHCVTPVVLVAQEFPNPDRIDEDWVIRNDWIFRRVILDDSFVPALDYVTTKVVGDEKSLQELYENVQQQRRITEELKEELLEIRQQAGSRYAALQASVEKRAQAMEEEDGGGLLGWTLETTFGGDSANPEAMRVREDAARDAYERSVKQEKDLQARLDREVTALNALTETYTKNLSDHLNRRAQIARLLVHIKANIMYYMQAIWSHEPKDQRFFRLHEVPVPKLKGKMTYKLEVDADAIPLPPDWKKPFKLVVKCKLDPDLEFQTLEEAADLNNLLGFKGNYMIFPMKENNVLTDFMMTPYYDPTTVIRDPDILGNWTLSEFAEYVCCLHKNMSNRMFERLIPGLKEMYRILLTAPGADGEDIVVPTNSLFIEALPGVHPILEDFKLMHRVIDVKKAQASVRAAELNNIRSAARILAKDYEDPDIEKKVVIENGQNVIVPEDNT
jgi:hypothetical protein